MQQPRSRWYQLIKVSCVVRDCWGLKMRIIYRKAESSTRGQYLIRVCAVTSLESRLKWSIHSFLCGKSRWIGHMESVWKRVVTIVLYKETPVWWKPLKIQIGQVGFDQVCEAWNLRKVSKTEEIQLHKNRTKLLVDFMSFLCNIERPSSKVD